MAGRLGSAPAPSSVSTGRNGGAGGSWALQPRVQRLAPALRRQRQQRGVVPCTAWGGHEPPPKDLASDPEAKFRQ
jgi:hypothetical protein